MSLLDRLMQDPWGTIMGVDPIPPKDLKKKGKGGYVPPARSTEAPEDFATYSFLNDKQLVKPGYQFEIIPLLRKLTLNNESVSQAMYNLVSLANTGHDIEFNADIPAEQVDKMRQHLDNVAKNWQYGIAGRHGLSNKLISQAAIAGAMCVEAVPNLNLDGLHRVLLPYPETIRFLYNKATITYEPYQVSKTIQSLDNQGFKKLNPNTFRYVAINGDSEIPYGNPLYLPVIRPLEVQQDMMDNIRFIIKQIGVVGFLELLVEKPDQADGETDAQYATRLNIYLRESKQNLNKSLKEGIAVGFEGDHAFKFNSITKNATGVSEFYNENQKRVFSGLKQDGALSGEGGKGAETSITLVFTKLLSELKNIQLCAGTVLEFIYDFELRLAGFEYKTLNVKYKASTILDDLKFNQSMEIKVRVLSQLIQDGIISQEQYADALGYEKPASAGPIVPYARDVQAVEGDPSSDAQQKQKREKGKDASDVKSRERVKPQNKAN